MARTRTRSGEAGGLALFVIVCCLVVVFTAVERTHHAESELLHRIDASLQTLQGQDLALSPLHFDLEILSVPVRERSAGQIERMLSAVGDKGGIFSFVDRKFGIYAISAQAIDRRQHLANTFLEGYEPFKVDNPALPLYVIARRKRYEFDRIQYSGREDVWQSSRQAFFYPRGDCEDHAILLADWLISMGEDARVVLGEMQGEGHAWVVLFKDGKEYLLEATQKRGLSRNKPYPLAQLFTDYRPKYMFNREDFWEKTATKVSTSYAGKSWKKKSRLRFGRGA